MRCLTILVAGGAYCGMWAQDSTTVDRLYNLDVHILIGDAQSQLHRNMPAYMPGVSMSLLRQVNPEEPTFIGMRWQYLHHASRSVDYTDVIGSDLVDFEQRTSSNLMDLGLIARFYSPRSLGRLTPFVDGSVGVRALYTFTSDQPVDGGDEGSFDFERFRVTPYLTAAVGGQYPVWEDLMLNFKVSYTFALSTSYYSAITPSPAVSDSRDAFQQRNTAIDILLYELGVTYWW